MFQKDLIVLHEAKEDLELGKFFYDSIELGAGSYFVNSLLSDLESLKFLAGVHKKVFGYYQALSKRFPFGVYYDIEDETVIVLAIIDMRQNPNSIKDRLDSNN